jgi:hypothetical protein
VADELTAVEHALRKLPMPYSLALRLREAGVAAEVISEYLGVAQASLDGVYRLAEAKLSALQEVGPDDSGTRGGTGTSSISSSSAPRSTADSGSGA